MFKKIIDYSIHHKLTVGVFVLALVAWGAWSLATLPFDSTPDITDNQVQVITQAPALGAQEVEQYITTPLEMAMANIPRLRERRSISRSGLSVITLVFDDGADIYWARSQVSQTLQEAAKELPQNAEVEMGPIATALGEIYHYTLHARRGYEHRYSLTQLRTYQDWIVRKQLSGTRGVAEVSGWGGYVKQYEVAVNSDRLAASGVTLSEVFEALQTNNANTGGSYIEQESNQYFIRGIGVARSLSDLRNTTVKTVNGVVVKVGDVAQVQMGHATRFGAVTRNGEGEVVVGIAIMLKGENFQQVSRRVKARIAEIQKALPEGVVIEPFIDRTSLVDRVEGTIAHNLIAGGLIVVFVLVLFLGSWRSGLVVAGVIPLSMLFAFGMMRVFGVGGNLMSLGAIDFGMVVDAAVIIVEAVVAHINSRVGPGRTLTRREMDAEVGRSALTMMKSAAFGQIIIMVVYIPIMLLEGVEGKMFRPMALTVFFAILGAFILSLTYVPAASALFLSRKPKQKANLSDRMMAALRAGYRPILAWVLRRRKDVITGAAALFCASAVAFHFLGGEFIPTLEEGDLVVEASMAQGTSLSQMVATCTRVEKLLKREFPEVRQVVSRIGSAEIPTDPMPMERADIMISLKPKREWTSARTTAELMDRVQHALEQLPGLECELSQPIQMRQNELMTGIQQDVAIKIYGDDLERLADAAARVNHLISDVRGVSSTFVEKVAGLPQIQVVYHHDRLAEYGLSVDAVNRLLEATYAGAVAGSIYEGERKFDVVLRMNRADRNNLESLRSLRVPFPQGGSVPLQQLASIDYKEAPAQVSHEDGMRRIFVGFNVRGRDVQSTVADIQRILSDKLQLPEGFYYTYGGQFQNLQSATRRLMVVLPIALCVILFLLYATMQSVREALFVASAIPLAAMGGVWALWLRGLNFSISAGVGFIALFGVAVLNGVVLVNQMNQMQRAGVADVDRRITESCMLRLRPVLMTALVASLGFLPMALSTGDGAEVQRPLATVVIGGLITSTLLTLLVLPAIYKAATPAKAQTTAAEQTLNAENK